MCVFHHICYDGLSEYEMEVKTPDIINTVKLIANTCKLIQWSILITLIYPLGKNYVF